MPAPRETGTAGRGPADAGGGQDAAATRPHRRAAGWRARDQGRRMMLEFVADPNFWASLLTLTALEIVLGIDNLIFLSIVSGRLPAHQQRAARQLGLALALLGRVGLLFSLTWLIGLTEPVAAVLGFAFSWRDIVLVVGGLFLLVKGTMETHHMLEGQEEGAQVGTTTFLAAVVQIIVLDVVFALDSI